MSANSLINSEIIYWIISTVIKPSGDNVDCWMEIQHGKGPWADPVAGIVPLGTTLTMVVGINDKLGNITAKWC